MKLPFLPILALCSLGLTTAQENSPKITTTYHYRNPRVTLDRAIHIHIFRFEFEIGNFTANEALPDLPKVYYRPPGSEASLPLGNAKFDPVPSGRSIRARVPLRQYDLANYSEATGQRVLSKGEHHFSLHNSQGELLIKTSVILDEDIHFDIKRGFSNQVNAVWLEKDKRKMVLKESLTFTDARGKRWTAPRGTILNGATIPPALWQVIGTPYIGDFRRASVVHDYFVGENGNPEPLNSDSCKKADRMFFEACITDGCSVEFASRLYAGVRFGSWLREHHKTFSKHGLFKFSQTEEQKRESERKKFEFKMRRLGNALEKGDLDKIDAAFSSSGR